jgi:hypothetical protein
MATKFIEHPDGEIIVVSDDGVYIDTRVNFEKDFQRSVPLKPVEATEANEHIYEPGIRHCYQRVPNLIAGGPLHWNQGDDIIAAVKILLERQAMRRQAIEDERLKEEVRRRERLGLEKNRVELPKLE